MIIRHLNRVCISKNISTCSHKAINKIIKEEAKWKALKRKPYKLSS